MQPNIDPSLIDENLGLTEEYYRKYFKLMDFIHNSPVEYIYEESNSNFITVKFLLKSIKPRRKNNA